jgi:hypothetical protein
MFTKKEICWQIHYLKKDYKWLLVVGIFGCNGKMFYLNMAHVLYKNQLSYVLGCVITILFGLLYYF